MRKWHTRNAVRLPLAAAIALGVLALLPDGPHRAACLEGLRAGLAAALGP